MADDKKVYIKKNTSPIGKGMGEDEPEWESYAPPEVKKKAEPLQKIFDYLAGKTLK